MNVKFTLFAFMLFFHIVDDYYLQGWLANAKQKKWWEKNAPESIYKYDYLCVLLMHSISWSFNVMIPITVYNAFSGYATIIPITPFILNIIIHFTVDHFKANLKKINLIQDQSIHILQILLTLIVCV